MGQTQSDEEEAMGPSPAEEASTMKALVMETPGDITDMKLATVYIPKPAVGEVRVKVMSAGLNPVDYKRGQFTDADFPCILGADVAGVVVELGKDVTNVRIGDRVYFHANVRKQYGGFAEHSLTDAATVVPFPPNLTFAQAAAVPCSGWTAYLALFHKLKIRAGQSILITGAAGGVGCFAIQLAKMTGLKVFAQTQPHKADFVRSFGADHIIFTGESEESAVSTILSLNGQLLDHALDTVGAPSATATLALLKLHGSLCSLAALVSSPDLFAKGISLHYVNIGGMHQTSAEVKQALAQIGRDVAALLAKKQLRVPIMEECGMQQIPHALEMLRKGLVMGKLVANIVPAAKQEAEAIAIATGTEAIPTSVPATTSASTMTPSTAPAPSPSSGMYSAPALPQQQPATTPASYSTLLATPPTPTPTYPPVPVPIPSTTGPQLPINITLDPMARGAPRTTPTNAVPGNGNVHQALTI